MSVPISLNVALKKRPGGQIINMLDWAISGGPAKWCDDVTYSADKTLTQTYIVANSFTINSGVTLTLTQLRPLIVIADTITINGTITASEKGCSAGVIASPWDGYRYTGFDWPFWISANQAVSQTRNYCLCGAGGGSGSTGVGGGAYGDGGATKSAGADCDLTDAELKELLFSPLFNIFQIGFGGGGGTYNAVGGDGGGLILLIGSTIVVSSTGNILANGEDGSNVAGAAGGGGGGGFIGLIGDSFNIHPSATITANGGAGGEDTSGSDDGGDGGDGACIQIEV